MKIFSFLKKPIFIGICVFLLFISLTANLEREPAESLDIPVAVGYDINGAPNNYTYKVIYSVYNFLESEVSSSVRVGYGNTIGAARQDKQTKSNKRFLFGLEKIYALSNTYAMSGIHSMMDILLSTPEVNDTAQVVVCKNPEDLLCYKAVGYPSSADYINGMVESAGTFNFFAKNYRLVDAYLNLGGEGRNLCLPYIDITDQGLKITGIALFKGHKMVGKLGINDTKAMNLLRENKSRGILTIQTTDKKYLNFYAKSNRSVQCTKVNNKYFFTINLKINGDIVSNELYKNLTEDIDKRNLFQRELSTEVEKMCNTFLISMKSNYKVDCLNLGMVACAKYGRNTGVDWNEIVSNSEIKVNVKIILDKLGRGDY